MIQIGSMRDLEQYGIEVLTGEACGYGYRLLCDLTERGIKLVAKCFDVDYLKFRDSLNPAWNSKGVRSLMISPHMLVPLGIFACIESNCSKVYVMHDGGVVGIEAKDEPEQVEMWLSWNQGKYCEACNRYGAGGGVNLQYTNHGFSRHVHQMSGRER